MPRIQAKHTRRFTHWTVASVALLLAVIVAGCDWFNQPVEVNLLPWVRIVNCPDVGELLEGDDVTFEWQSDDLDGEIAGFEWSLDDSLGETTETSESFTDLAAGDYEFIVTAFDEEGGESEPDTCGFNVGSAGGLVERTVLCEMLTTKSCINCWKAELALVRMIEEFGDRAAVIVYHYFLPPVDPMGTPETIARCDWYYTYDNFDNLWGTYPVTIFDGLDFEDDAPDTTSTKIAFRSRIDDRLDVGSPVSIAMGGDAGSARGDVTVTVRVHEQLTGGPYTLRMVVIEDEVWDGEEYFEFVARDFLDAEPLTVSAAGDSAVMTRNFSIGTWDPQHLDVVAFLQDDSSAEIVQSARLSTQ